MLELLPRIPLYQSFRALGFPKMMPLNITVGVSNKCNSRCRTCNVWKKNENEFSLEEFDKSFKSIGKAPFWFTMSGGEPFLRQDIVELCRSAYERCTPSIINIPTNGILWKTIPKKAKEIAEACSGAKIIVNLSLDEIGEKHDQIRNVPGNWSYAMKTYEKLRSLKLENFELGIHTVISKFNVARIPQIYDKLIKLEPDSYITEIAEERIELDTIGSGITPSIEDYSKAIDFLSAKIRERRFSGTAKIIQAFRLNYYEMVKKTLRDKRQVIPCYAGFASAQIAPNGEIWACCIKAGNLGSLRENNYNFGKIWFSEKAKKVRDGIKRKECYCPLANAAYTNMLMHYPALIGAGLKVLK